MFNKSENKKNLEDYEIKEGDPKYWKFEEFMQECRHTNDHEMKNIGIEIPIEYKKRVWEMVVNHQDKFKN